MTYDDWKSTDDTPISDDYRCEFCNGYCVAINRLCACCDRCLMTHEPMEVATT